ncbi:MAG TPA: gephyrin-like molybdotransferase Glp [candidate division Zixibacteria bacterium]|nr:gephyrin-like molybdotransferase Glp [candidate division Zixibacteria bacterium]
MDEKLLSVDQALQQVLAGISLLPAERVSLMDALGRVLLEPAVSADDLPHFANSSMDGYAVKAEDVAGASEDLPVKLRVIGDIPAGTVAQISLSSGEAARIMTGAPLPFGADAVIPVELTSEPWRQSVRPLPDQIDVRGSVDSGGYIRWPGEDVRKGTEVLPSGHVLRPQEIGVLSAIGLTEISVVQTPRVAVLATGDELIEASEPLAPGKIRNSNSPTLTAQIRSSGAIAVDLGVARDSFSDVQSKLDDALERDVNLIISTAGVSVGAYDVVKDVLDSGGEVGFWRVNMRPGKPLAYGEYRGIPFLGLPGNPVSAMVSFERFARPAILKMAGHRKLDRPRVRATVKEDIHSDGRESYLRAIVVYEDGGYSVDLSGRQGSHVMTSLVQANGLLIVPAGTRLIQSGQAVEVMMIDWPETVF